MSVISTGTTLTSGLVLTSDTNGELIIKTGASAVTAATFSSGGTATLSNVAITSLTVSSPSVFPAGSASAPAVTTTGDTNTGVYFPAADQVAVTTGGTVAAAFNSNGLFFRNRIINGDMRIDQRNAGASGTANGYTVDRFAYYGSQASKGTWQQNAASVTPPAGYVNYLGFTSSSAYTVGASEEFELYQAIEGTNVADLGWGAAGALTVTLSFWVRSSLTGTFGGALQNTNGTRSYPFSYTISAANTWEYKTVTAAGDTTGTWLTTTGIGLVVYFGLGVGSTKSGTAGAWAGAYYTSATSATSVVGTNGATFYITGVQLETGSVATPFERRPYGTELMLCQRYYSKYTKATFRSADPSSSQTYWATNLDFKVTMRATPTVTLTSPTTGASGVIDRWGGVDLAVSSTDVDSTRLQYAVLTTGVTSGLVAQANVAASAEL
jgi:hypothetical protein